MIKVYSPELLGPEDDVAIGELDAALTAAGM
jgi:hypothetical protein